MQNGYWSLIGTNSVTANYNSVLSITILPTIFTTLLNVSGELLFKILYMTIFALVPTILYEIYQIQISQNFALISAFFVISSPLVLYGFEAVSLNRQITGAFFLALSVLIILSDKIPISKRRVLLLVFGVGLVVSHYSLAYLYLAFIIAYYAISRIMKHQTQLLNGAMVAFLALLVFLWNDIVTSPLESLQSFFTGIYTRFFADIASPAARSSTIFTSHVVQTPASLVNWILFYAIHAFVIIGILTMIFRARKVQLNSLYRTFAILSVIVLALCVIIPNFAPAFEFTRFYGISLFFLAPCLIFGVKQSGEILRNAANKLSLGRKFQNVLNKRNMSLLLCFLLMFYFLSQFGFLNFVTSASPQSPVLDFQRLTTSNDVSILAAFHNGYIEEIDVASATWLSSHRSINGLVFADYNSILNVVTSYGRVQEQSKAFLSNPPFIERNSLVYLSQLNIDNNTISSNAGLFNYSTIAPVIEKTSLIYSNGHGEIWFYR